MAARTTLAFVVAATAWGFATEKLLVETVTDRSLLLKLEVANSVLFVVLAAAVIYAMLRVQLSRMAREATARHQAEAEARASETRLHLALKAGRVGVWEHDFRTGKVTWSDTYEALWGLKPGEFSGRLTDVLGRIHPDDRTWCISHIETLHQKPEPFDYVLRVVWDDGSIHWLSGHGEPSYDDAGHPLVLRGAAREITREKEAEEALATSQLFLRDLVETSGSLIYAKDREGRYLLVNRIWETTTGHTREDAIGRTDLEIFPGESGAAFRKSDLQAMALGKATTFEEQLPEILGTRTFVSVKFPTRDSTGRVTGICGITTEITEVARAKEALAVSERRYRQLFESNPLPMWVYCCASESIVSVNQAAIVHYGYSQEEFLAMKITDLDAPLLDQPPAESGEPNLRRHRLKDGRFVLVEVTTQSFDFNGHPSMLVLAIDVTPRKEAEAALLHSFDEIRAQNEMMNRFNRAAVDRELRMVALKKEINILCRQLGQPLRYPAVENAATEALAKPAKPE